MSILEKFQFRFNPFDQVGALKDPHLSDYFVDTGLLKILLRDKENCVVVFAPRGGGKTATRIMFERNIPDDQIVIVYAFFPFALDNTRYAIQLEEHMVEIIRLVLLRILHRLSEKPELLHKMSEPDRFMIGYLAHKTLDDVSFHQQDEALRSVSGLATYTKLLSDWYHSGGQATIKTLIGSLTGLFSQNGSQTVTIENQTDVEQKLNDNGYAVWAPTKQAVVASYFSGVIGALQRLGWKKATIVIDSVDELPQTAGDSEHAFSFVKSLLSNVFVYERGDVEFRIFLWDRIEKHFIPEKGIRTDKFKVRKLIWNREQLDRMLTQRLSAASSVKSFDELVGKDIPISIHRLLTYLAAGSPRDLVRLAGLIIDKHDENNAHEHITLSEVWQATREFCGARLTELIEGANERKYITGIRKSTCTRAELAKYWNMEDAAAEWIQKFRDLDLLRVVSVGKNNENLYGFSDLRIAIGSNPKLELENFLKNIKICKSCSKPIITERSKLVCEPCKRTQYNSNQLLSIWQDCRP